MINYNMLVLPWVCLSVCVRASRGVALTLSFLGNRSPALI